MTGSDYSALCKQSPDKAYKTLFDEYCNYVYTVVYSKMRDCATREDIEECVSDIFAEIYTKYDTEKPYDGDMRGYVGAVAKHKAINAFKSLSAKGETVSLDDEGSPELADDRTPEAEQQQTELSRILLNKILALGEPDSTIVVQRYYYNRNAVEIAWNLKMSPAAVRMRCQRSMAKLKEMLAELDINI